jgi:hypothetical protein
MEHNKIVGHKPARDTETYKIKTTTAMAQPPHSSLQILKTHFKDLYKFPCKVLLLTSMICQYAVGGLLRVIRDEEGFLVVQGCA